MKALEHEAVQREKEIQLKQYEVANPSEIRLKESEIKLKESVDGTSNNTYASTIQDSQIQMK